MNLGWYEIMDRISVIQSQLQDSVYEHQESDIELQRILNEAQEHIYRAYEYASEKFNDSCEECE